MTGSFKSKTPFGSRVYELDDSTVKVRGDIPLKGDFEIKITLRDLDPQYERLWIRSHFLVVGMWFFAIGILAYVVETAFVGMDGWGSACLFTLMWAFIGVVLVLVGKKKHQIARFKTRAGVPTVDVFEDGPMKVDFQGFVDELVARISRSHEKA